MSRHRAIIEAGPAPIRQLCCDAESSADNEVIRAALGAIDDRVALVRGRPVAVESLWCAALRSLPCVSGALTAIVIHPSWWSSSRVVLATNTVSEAVATPTGKVLTRPRSWLLTRAGNRAANGSDSTVVVEIAERLVVVVGAEMVAVPRGDEPRLVAVRVAHEIACLMPHAPASVVIDAPSTVSGSEGLAALIAEALRDGGPTVVQVGDALVTRLARSAAGEPPAPTAPSGGRPRGAWTPARRFGVLAVCASAMTVLPLAVSAPATRDRPRAVVAKAVPAAPAASLPSAFLVEGRVALTVPAGWATQRVVAGPGSARVQATSPSDSEVALHVTQSPAPGETLSGTAERLQHAIAAEPDGVFLDFNPLGSTAGRPAVTYREVRPGHHVRWTVFVDGPVRISIGCQSRPGAEDDVRVACEQAVRSARAIGT